MTLWDNISSERIAALLASQGYPQRALEMYGRIWEKNPDLEGIAEKARSLSVKGRLPSRFTTVVPLFETWTRLMSAENRSRRLKQMRRALPEK